MCLSTVYGFTDLSGGKRVLCDYVSRVELDGGLLTFYDILGNETRVSGRLTDVDLVKNCISVRLDAGEQAGAGAQAEGGGA
jgi:predicted RNA-binding protein